VSSHEEFKKEEKQYIPGEDILQELSDEANFNNDLTPNKIPEYSKENIQEQNTFNKLTNKIASNIYSYNDKSDYTYRTGIMIIQKIKCLYI